EGEAACSAGREGGDGAIRPSGPADGATEPAIARRGERAGRAVEPPPAQRLALRWRDVDDAAVVEAIGADAAVRRVEPGGAGGRWGGEGGHRQPGEGQQAPGYAEHRRHVYQWNRTVARRPAPVRR